MTIDSAYIDLYSQLDTLHPNHESSKLRSNATFQTMPLAAKSRMSPPTMSKEFPRACLPRLDGFSEEHIPSIDGVTSIDKQVKADGNSLVGQATPNSPPPARSPTISDLRPVSPPERGGSRSGSISYSKRDGKKDGKSKWGLRRLGLARRDSVAQSADTSSISSSTLEKQRLEDISLTSLISGSKGHGRGINVFLSGNSTRALFWTPGIIQIWDVGTSPPTFTRSIFPENTCLMASVTKSFLAYITGPSDQKLTVRYIMKLRMKVTMTNVSGDSFELSTSHKQTHAWLNIICLPPSGAGAWR